MRKLSVQPNHEDRKVQKLLEEIAKKKAAADKPSKSRRHRF